MGQIYVSSRLGTNNTLGKSPAIRQKTPCRLIRQKHSVVMHIDIDICSGETRNDKQGYKINSFFFETQS